MTGGLAQVTGNAQLTAMQASGANGSKAAKTLQSAKESGDMQRIEEAAQEFEAVFIAEMMKPMFEGIEAEAPFNGGKGEEVFRGMMLQEYGKVTVQNGGFGIADQVKAAMIEMQEQANNGGSYATPPITK